MKAQQIRALELNVPHFFERADFLTWLTNPENNIATWHVKGEDATEFADTFLIYDHGDCGAFDCDDFPQDIAIEITAICQREGFEYGILRLTNLAE